MSLDGLIGIILYANSNYCGMKALTHYIVYFIIGLSLIACSHDTQITGTLDEEPTIFPDYKEVTIPVNIAPLNFVVQDAKGISLGNR